MRNKSWIFLIHIETKVNTPGWVYWLASGHTPQRKTTEPERLRCAECGAAMRIAEIVQVNCRALVEHSLAYRDSG
ncbi:MAG TPA: hypothetical protein VMM76_00505 [Pirellulaceae bacterium]|nr:hypothetical protein [Pirellulaceae bacterium]